MSRSLAAGIGLAADRLLREPTRVPHPVAAFGTAMGHLERWCYAPTRPPGVAYAAAGVTIGASAGRLARSTALATYVAVAGRALGEAALAVNTALDAGDSMLHDDFCRRWSGATRATWTRRRSAARSSSRSPRTPSTR